MGMKNVFRVGILLLLLLLAACGDAPPTEPQTDTSTRNNSIDPNAPTIVIGDVSNNIDATTDYWQPMADYLAANLDAYERGAVRVAQDLDTMAEWLRNGEVDIYIDSSYPTIYTSDISGAEIVLRHWRGGVDEYHTVIFAMADSGLTSLDDLVGQHVAFDRAASTSGNFLPTIFLRENGYTLAELSGVNADVPEGTIGYIFSGEDVNTIQWVLSGRVDAGAVESIEFDNLPRETRNAITVIAETRSLPRQLVSFTPNMDDEISQAIIAIMTDMESSEAGQAVLEHIDTTRFDELPDGVVAFRDDMQALLTLFETE